VRKVRYINTLRCGGKDGGARVMGRSMTMKIMASGNLKCLDCADKMAECVNA
jgi:hypothetical protein